MRIIHLFLAFLLLILLCITWLQVFPEGPMMTTHPLYPSMLVGQYTLANAYWVGVLFGWSIISIFIGCLFLGLANSSKHKSKGRWLGIGYVLFCMAYGFMIVADLNYTSAGETNYFLGFPTPTAWMIYGMWFLPIFFSLLYILKFNSWVISPNDLKKFDVILQRRQQKRT